MTAVTRCFRFLQGSQRCLIQRPLLCSHNNSLVKTSCRQLLNRRILALDWFEKGVKIRREQFGKRAEDFKATLLESLDDPEVELVDEDCLSYIYLMTADDLPHLLKLLKRHKVQQVADDEQAGDVTGSISLAAHALRICHLLGNAEAALQVFNLHLNDAIDVTSIALLMDLLYEKQLYSDCAHIALKHLVGKGELSRKQLQPLLTIAFLSALQMDGDGGFHACTALQKEWIKMGGSNVKYVQWLFTSYAIQQGRTNMALANLSHTPSDDQPSTEQPATKQPSTEQPSTEQPSTEQRTTELSDRAIHLNLKALAYLKSKQELVAFNIILKLQSTCRDSARDSAQHPILFSDVYSALYVIASRRNHVEFIGHARENQATMVHRKSHSAYLTQRLIRHYTRLLDKTKTFPIFDEPTDVDPFSPYSNSFDTQEALNGVEVSSNDSAKSNDNIVETKDSKRSKKMLIRNGYITFVDDETGVE